jgi:hypothetical protein
MNSDLKNAVAGRTVSHVEEATLRFADGTGIRFWLSGDCCSQSDWTKVEQFKDLLGSKIFDAEERYGHSDNNLPEPENSDCISWHFLVFVTDKGHVTIDWHNDSNGYYDGELHWQMV